MMSETSIGIQYTYYTTKDFPADLTEFCIKINNVLNHWIGPDIAIHISTMV